MPRTGFAILDVETTGLLPGGHDRVIELAVVLADEHGTVTDRFETLLNPGRDLGPQRIHGIRAADVLDAPTFADIAPKLAELLAGRVPVAHNASFDERFLVAELERAGHELWQRPEFLCTMQLAREFLPGAGRSLADCCAAYDIELANAHRALVDALATAQLLAAYMAQGSDPDYFTTRLDAASAYQWPASLAAASASRPPWKPRPEHPVDTSASHFLERITIKLPDHDGPAECTDYLALLDRALLDRHVSAHEANALVALAEELGISRTTVETLHLEYFEALTEVAWSDGELTDAELADLVAVADLLSLPTTAIEKAASGSSSPPTAGVSRPPEKFTLTPGDLITLTGDMSRPREQIEADLIARGFVPWNAITKKVKLLVAADPDSLSGKARKARDYGVPVVGEAWIAEVFDRVPAADPPSIRSSIEKPPPARLLL